MEVPIVRDVILSLEINAYINKIKLRKWQQQTLVIFSDKIAMINNRIINRYL